MNAIMSEDKLIYRLMNAIPVADSIMNSLSVPDLSAFLFALGIELSDEMRQRYLDPIRDAREHQVRDVRDAHVLRLGSINLPAATSHVASL